MANTSWQDIEVEGRQYKAVQLWTPFTLDGIFYPSGSWLVWAQDGPDSSYAKAMKEHDFHEWAKR